MGNVRLFVVSSDFRHYDVLEKEVDRYLKQIANDVKASVEVVLVHNNFLGERYAKTRNLPTKVFKDDNYRQLLKYSTNFIFFWDGKNKQLKDILSQCGLKGRVVEYSYDLSINDKKEQERWNSLIDLDEYFLADRDR